MVEPDGTVPHGLDTRQQLADHGTGNRVDAPMVVKPRFES
jgi:hypothetical protein